MGKLEKFNHIMFASICAIGFICILAAGASFLFDLIPTRGHSNQVLAGNKVQKLAKEGVRTQVISLEEPILIDSLKHIYLIPVSQKKLKHNEEMVSHNEERMPSSMDKVRIYRGAGEYNNLLLFNAKDDSQKALFDSRICINRFEVFKSDSNFIIWMLGTTKDSNKDGFLTSADLEELYVYSSQTGMRSSYKPNNRSILEVTVDTDMKSLILSVGDDRDKNGEYEFDCEPTGLEICGFNLGDARPLVELNLLTRMQKIIEGSQIGDK